MVKRIWAVGASARALAQSLARAGFEPSAADQFSDLDLTLAFPTQKLIHYPESLTGLIDSAEADAWVYTGGLENYPELIDTLAERLPLLGNRGNVVRAVRDIELLQHVVQRAGLQMPEMSQQSPGRNHREWLRKSRRSAGGLRVFPAGRSRLGADEYFQRFAAGTCYGAAFIAARDQTTLLGITRQLNDAAWTHAPRFHYAGSIGPVTIVDSVQERLVSLGQQLAAEFGLRGWFGIDFIVDPHGEVFVLEVNPRYTASVEVLERALELPSARWHVQACTSATFLVQPQSLLDEVGKVAGKAVLYGSGKPGSQHIQCDQLMRRVYALNDVADIPSSWFASPGIPILSVFAEEDSEQEVESQLMAKSAAPYAEFAVS